MATGIVGMPAYASVAGTQPPPTAEVVGTQTQSLARGPGPQPPVPSDHDLLLELVQRYEVLGNAVVKLSEKIADPGRAIVTQGAPAAAGSGVDLIGKLIDVATKALGGNTGGGNDLLLDLYRKAHENFDQRVLMPTFTNLARGEVRHVSGGHVG